jgi:hypothetical protein
VPKYLVEKAKVFIADHFSDRNSSRNFTLAKIFSENAPPISEKAQGTLPAAKKESMTLSGSLWSRPTYTDRLKDLESIPR